MQCKMSLKSSPWRPPELWQGFILTLDFGDPLGWQQILQAVVGGLTKLNQHHGMGTGLHQPQCALWVPLPRDSLGSCYLHDLSFALSGSAKGLCQTKFLSRNALLVLCALAGQDSAQETEVSSCPPNRNNKKKRVFVADACRN